MKKLTIALDLARARVHAACRSVRRVLLMVMDGAFLGVRIKKISSPIGRVARLNFLKANWKAPCCLRL